ncbi:hypothetical protein RIF29_38024 [Crotalaria pallida]|uniref:Uncharacterized protein n=1 Tax=Crotalaria pallida TaxID=3830 RepID=A0AAN9E1G1_CROPI
MLFCHMLKAVLTAVRDSSIRVWRSTRGEREPGDLEEKCTGCDAASTAEVTELEAELEKEAKPLIVEKGDLY